MYWGCDKAGNRLQWALFCGASFLCAVLWIGSQSERNSCKLCDVAGDELSNCKALRREDWNNFDEATSTVHGCSIRAVYGTFFAGLVAFVLATIPLCVMGCAQKPDDQLASHSDLLRQSLQFYVGQPSDITEHARSAAAAPADNGARYSAMYNAMYN